MKKPVHKRILMAFFFFFFVYIFSVSSCFLTVQDADGKVVFSRSAPTGFSFILRYIHSVEQTPVEGEYRIVGGCIRQWEERVRSHNAGLPADAPRNGRFFSGEDWMHVQGGRAVFPSIRYRVGNSILGRNVLALAGEEIELYKLYPDSLLLFGAEKRSVAGSLVSIFF
jgi:hypothetical protein